MQAEFTALREQLEHAQPRGGTEQSLHRLVLDRFKRLTSSPAQAAQAGVFFKYRDSSGRWRLAWCWGCERKGSALGPLAVCPSEDCREVSVLPHKSARCPRCQSRLGKSNGLKPMLAALLLILGLAGGAWYWWQQPHAASDRTTLQGTVVFASDPNRPIAGAKLLLADGKLTTTDEKGRFTFQDLPLESVKLQISAAGFQAETVEQDLQKEDQREVTARLRGAGALRGVVLSRLTGRPIKGAKVSLPEFSQSTLTDDKGEFHLGEIPGESVRVVAAAKGFRTGDRTESALPASNRKLEWPLEGAGQLRGTVIDALTLKPVPAAEIFVQGTSLREKTDDRGQFAIANLPSGSTTIAVQAPGYLPEHLGSQLAGTEVTPIRVGLYGSGVRMGIVRSASDNLPVAGAEIRLPDFGRTIKTNDLGEYELTKLPPGRVALQIEAPGFRPLEKTVAVSGDSAALPWELTGNAVLIGTVKDAVENTPLAGVEIRIAGSHLTAKTRPDGRFRLENVPGRTARVQILGKGYQLVELEQAFSGGKEASIEVALKGGTILSGLVQDAATQVPIADATVQLAGTSRKTQSDTAGRFRFEEVVAGPANLAVSAAGYRAGEQTVQTKTGEETQIALALKGNAAIAGTVLQSEDETPLAGVKLKLVGTSRETTSDENGKFRFADVKSGLVVLQAERPGYEPSVISRNLKQDEEAPLQMALLGAASLQGTVTDPAGKALANATIRLKDQGIEKTTDAQGRFQIAGLTPGKVQIEIAGQGFQPQSKTVQLAIDRPTSLDAIALQSDRKASAAKPSLQEKPPTQDREKEAERLFEVGRDFVHARKIDEGREWLEDVVARYSETVAAQKARDLLASLKPPEIAKNVPEPMPREVNTPKNQEEPRDVVVDFFGVKGKGNSFVFIVDCSGSMTEQAGETTRFQRARSELHSALQQLTDHQKFYVIFYNTGTFPQPFPRRNPGMLPGSWAARSVIRPWIQEVQAGGGTQPQESFRVAFPLKPDVIFFLTDGEIPAETREIAFKGNQNRAEIDTIGFCVKDTSGILKGIARDHHGQYQYVPPY